jgi:hypothetical protein
LFPCDCQLEAILVNWKCGLWGSRFGHFLVSSLVRARVAMVTCQRSRLIVELLEVSLVNHKGQYTADSMKQATCAREPRSRILSGILKLLWFL